MCGGVRRLGSQGTLPTESVIQEIKDVILDQPIIHLRLIHRQVPSGLLWLAAPGHATRNLESSRLLAMRAIDREMTDSADRNKAERTIRGCVCSGARISAGENTDRAEGIKQGRFARSAGNEELIFDDEQ